jgi:hypothetical protein
MWPAESTGELRMATRSKLNPFWVRGARWVCAVLGLTLCSAGTVLAAECFPYCDYNHNYGPYDFTYVKPGLWGYATCGPRGYCLPRLSYSVTGRTPRGNIEVRTLPRRAPQ